MIDREEEALGVVNLWPAEQRVGAVHAVPGQLAGDGPVHADLEHVAGLDPGTGQADGVARQDLLRERHGMGSRSVGGHLFVRLSQHRERL